MTSLSDSNYTQTGLVDGELVGAGSLGPWQGNVILELVQDLSKSSLVVRISRAYVNSQPWLKWTIKTQQSSLFAHLLTSVIT